MQCSVWFCVVDCKIAGSVQKSKIVSREEEQLLSFVHVTEKFMQAVTGNPWPGKDDPRIWMRASSDGETKPTISFSEGTSEACRERFVIKQQHRHDTPLDRGDLTFMSETQQKDLGALLRVRSALSFFSLDGSCTPGELPQNAPMGLRLHASAANSSKAASQPSAPGLPLAAGQSSQSTGDAQQGQLLGGGQGRPRSEAFDDAAASLLPNVRNSDPTLLATSRRTSGARGAAGGRGASSTGAGGKAGGVVPAAFTLPVHLPTSLPGQSPAKPHAEGRGRSSVSAAAVASGSGSASSSMLELSLPGLAAAAPSPMSPSMLDSQAGLPKKGKSRETLAKENIANHRAEFYRRELFFSLGTDEVMAAETAGSKRMQYLVTYLKGSETSARQVLGDSVLGDRVKSELDQWVLISESCKIFKDIGINEPKVKQLKKFTDQVAKIHANKDVLAVTPWQIICQDSRIKAEKAIEERRWSDAFESLHWPNLRKDSPSLVLCDLAVAQISQSKIMRAIIAALLSQGKHASNQDRAISLASALLGQEGASSNYYALTARAAYVSEAAFDVSLDVVQVAMGASLDIPGKHGLQQSVQRVETLPQELYVLLREHPQVGQALLSNAKSLMASQELQARTAEMMRALEEQLTQSRFAAEAILPVVGVDARLENNGEEARRMEQFRARAQATWSDIENLPETERPLFRTRFGVIIARVARQLLRAGNHYFGVWQVVASGQGEVTEVAGGFKHAVGDIDVWEVQWKNHWDLLVKEHLDAALFAVAASTSQASSRATGQNSSGTGTGPAGPGPAAAAQQQGQGGLGGPGAGSIAADASAGHSSTIIAYGEMALWVEKHCSLLRKYAAFMRLLKNNDYEIDGTATCPRSVESLKEEPFKTMLGGVAGDQQCREAFAELCASVAHVKSGFEDKAVPAQLEKYKKFRTPQFSVLMDCIESLTSSTRVGSSDTGDSVLQASLAAFHAMLPSQSVQELISAIESAAPLPDDFRSVAGFSMPTDARQHVHQLAVCVDPDSTRLIAESSLMATIKCKLVSVGIMMETARTLHVFQKVLDRAESLSEDLQLLLGHDAQSQGTVTEIKEFLHRLVSDKFITHLHDGMERVVMPAIPPDYDSIVRSKITESLRNCFMQKRSLDLVSQIEEFETAFKKFKFSALLQAASGDAAFLNRWQTTKIFMVKAAQFSTTWDAVDLIINTLADPNTSNSSKIASHRESVLQLPFYYVLHPVLFCMKLLKCVATVARVCVFLRSDSLWDVRVLCLLARIIRT